MNAPKQHKSRQQSALTSGGAQRRQRGGIADQLQEHRSKKEHWTDYLVDVIDPDQFPWGSFVWVGHAASKPSEDFTAKVPDELGRLLSPVFAVTDVVADPKKQGKTMIAPRTFKLPGMHSFATPGAVYLALINGLPFPTFPGLCGRAMLGKLWSNRPQDGSTYGYWTEKGKTVFMMAAATWIRLHEYPGAVQALKNLPQTTIFGSFECPAESNPDVVRTRSLNMEACASVIARRIAEALWEDRQPDFDVFLPSEFRNQDDQPGQATQRHWPRALKAVSTVTGQSLFATPAPAATVPEATADGPQEVVVAVERVGEALVVDVDQVAESLGVVAAVQDAAGAEVDDAGAADAEKPAAPATVVVSSALGQALSQAFAIPATIVSPSATTTFGAEDDSAPDVSAVAPDAASDAASAAGQFLPD